MATPTLHGMHLLSRNVGAAAAFLATVCSAELRSGPNRAEVLVGDATIVVEPSDGSDGSKAKTISALVIDRPGVEPTATELNGVTIITKPRDQRTAAARTDVALDHIAILVTDLDSAAQHWEAATGAAAEMIGIHPVSRGTLRAVRLELGDRMIELISPVHGTSSALANRLGTHGEGPFAVALPAVDLDAKRQQLEANQIRTLWQEPHWLIHPANPAKVLIQLTPRVRH